jgi:hypothetical protein
VTVRGGQGFEGVGFLGIILSLTIQLCLVIETPKREGRERAELKT